MDEERLVTLVRRAQGGNREAQGALVEHFESTVFVTVLRRLRNRSEAKDVTQDVFVQALRKLPTLREPVRFVGWLRRIAVRMSINRAVRRPRESACNPHMLLAYEPAPSTPLENLLHGEEMDQVRGGLKQLRPLDRETLIAFYFEGRSLKEMSIDFERPIGTIKRRLHTARNRLRAELVDFDPRERASLSRSRS